MPARSAFPLFLLMLAWTLASRVHCQTLEVSLVSTQYVEITWERELQWFGVSDFQVDISSVGNSDCLQPVACSTPACSFQSLVCGLYQPCTPTNVTVTGGNYTAPALELVTGPDKVTDMTLRLEEGVQYISWVNPSKDSSPCYEQTAVKVSFNDDIFIDYFDHGNESTSKALCVSGYGEVEVWAEGGDGQSISSSGIIVYNGSDVVNLVTYETCEPVECTSIEVKWSYAPVCPDVAYFNITLYDVFQNVSINVTSTTVTGLEYDHSYYTCIRAMNKNGEQLDADCYSYCSTAYVVPQNLTVQPLSDSALHATWKPPVCQPVSEVPYYLRVDYRDYYTTATSYDVEGLDDFVLYEVKLGVDGYYYYDESSMLIVDAYTKLSAPNLYEPYVYQDSVRVYWYHYVSNDWGYDIYYKVTWGRNLSFHGETEEDYYYITGFSDIDEVFQVCVAAAPRGREDLTSETYCQFVEDSSVRDSGMEGWVIALVVVGVCLVAGLVIGTVLYQNKKSKAQSRQRRQQQLQQQQQQHHLQHMHGTHNPGASL